jgi:lysophospholipase L1-like esterase
MTRVVVAGDSVVWGQGLETDEKLHSILLREYPDVVGGAATISSADFRAHSGAVIDGGTLRHPSVVATELWQEVPHDSPNIIEQIESIAVSQTDAHPMISLVILNGGINDINFRVIADPFEDDERLDRSIRATCYVDMLKLLRTTRTRFPRATIVVLGYYPILSEHSSIRALQLTVALMLLRAGPIGPLVAEGIAKRSVRRFRLFHRRQLSWLRRAVTEMSNSPDTRGPGVLFAHPAFGPRNSVGAPESLLFSPTVPQDVEEAWAGFRRSPLSAILLVEPGDPLSTRRRVACNALTTGVENLQCLVASLGHPNQAGARRYAETIATVLSRSRSVSLRSELTKMLGPHRALRLRTALNRYGFSNLTGSVRAFVQHLAVDCIDVTIRTRDERFAGTDHDVSLRLGQGWQWKLNESVFDGDIFNDFERGITTTYSIDPSDGIAARRLQLVDITELSLELQMATDALLTDPVASWRPEWIQVALNGHVVSYQRINKELTLDDHVWTSPDFPHRN